jgi:septal ring factor EnvC (AmiA/AmiB activator)
MVFKLFHQVTDKARTSENPKALPKDAACALKESLKDFQAIMEANMHLLKHMLDDQSTMLDDQSQKLDAQSWTLDAQSWTLDAQSWTLDAHSKRLDILSGKLDAQSWKLDAQSEQLKAHSTQLEGQSTQLEAQATQHLEIQHNPENFRGHTIRLLRDAKVMLQNLDNGLQETGAIKRWKGSRRGGDSSGEDSLDI